MTCCVLGWQVIEALISELAPLFRHKYFHVGGDEFNLDCWKGNDGEGRGERRREYVEREGGERGRERERERENDSRPC